MRPGSSCRVGQYAADFRLAPNGVQLSGYLRPGCPELHGEAWDRVLVQNGGKPPKFALLPKAPNLLGLRGLPVRQGSFTCAEPDHIDACPVPRPHLRNGRLNQTAYSLFLFVRDIAGGDLIGWIDSQLEAATDSSDADLEPARQEALIGPLREVFGVADKVLTNALFWLMIGARNHRPVWFEAGKAMVAIDTLVHNFLHRTGILDNCGVPHRYGPACYAGGGCAEIIRGAAEQIDARSFNPNFPKIFPRFVQHALWRFCAADGLDLCNGNRIDDREPCQINYCYLFRICGRKTLKST
jgi:hypothetical protein